MYTYTYVYIYIYVCVFILIYLSIKCKNVKETTLKKGMGGMWKQQGHKMGNDMGIQRGYYGDIYLENAH